MRVERRELAGHEYVIVLTPEEAQRLHRMIKDAWWDTPLAEVLEGKLGEACLDGLRRIW